MLAQKQALENARKFIDSVNLDNPSLTGKIWNIINDKNNQEIITLEKSKQYSENWSFELVGELQRVLVNYQLHQLKLKNPPKLFEMIKIVFNRIEPNLSLLDIGCTSGYYYEIINHYFPGRFDYSGCDYNKNSIELAKNYYPYVNFSVEDITKLSFEEKCYDITFLSGVIEHVPDFKKGIKELCRITKKYIILHRIWLTDGKTSCKKGTQYFVPVIRNQYNKKEFFDLFEKRFKIIWESSVFDSNCKTYLLKSE